MSDGQTTNTSNNDHTIGEKHFTVGPSQTSKPGEVRPASRSVGVPTSTSKDQQPQTPLTSKLPLT